MLSERSSRGWLASSEARVCFVELCPAGTCLNPSSISAVHQEFFTHNKFALGMNLILRFFWNRLSAFYGKQAVVIFPLRKKDMMSSITHFFPPYGEVEKAVAVRAHDQEGE